MEISSCYHSADMKMRSISSSNMKHKLTHRYQFNALCTTEKLTRVKDLLHCWWDSAEYMLVHTLCIVCTHTSTHNYCKLSLVQNEQLKVNL